MPNLICYDNSPSAQHALEVARRSLGHDDAVLLHVWSPPERIHADSFGTSDSHSHLGYEQLKEFNAQRAADILAGGKQLADTLGLTVSIRAQCCQTSVWETILDVADELDVDLIVAGTHGTTAVTDGLLGSVSNALIHHSRRPVLIVPNRGLRSSGCQSTEADYGALTSPLG